MARKKTKQQTPESPFVNIKEAAAYLRVHRDVVRRLLDDGRLRHKRLGKRTIRIYRDSLEAVNVPA